MQYKVLALDLDGTLTNTEKVITPRTKAALQEAARRGVCIVLASGRPTVGNEPLARELELFIETMPLGVGKDTSLEILLRAKGLTPANLMACGDGWNDLPMIRLAGMGVAMGNAQPPVKAAANYLTADNDHDGVGLAVDKFIVNEET